MLFLYKNVKNLAAKYYQERASIGPSNRNFFSFALKLQEFSLNRQNQQTSLVMRTFLFYARSAVLEYKSFLFYGLISRCPGV